MTEPHYLQDELLTLLRDDPKMWSFLQQGSLDGVWYWDLERPDQEWMSPEFWHLLGIDPATKAHDPAEWQDIIFADDLAVALENFTAHCADPACPYDQVVRYRHADGSTVWVRCRGLAIRDETGKPVRMLGAHNDLTAAMTSEHHARAGWAAAESASEELRAFAYAMSHDLKAPANSLRLLLGELAHELGSDINAEARSLLEHSHQTVARMQTLIEHVLDYTRVVGMAMSVEQVPLDACLQDAIASLRADIETSGASLTIVPLPVIQANRAQMVLLFQNLIENAIRFRAPDHAPVVSISTAPVTEDRRYRISITDNGLGIPHASQERIFSLFQRLHAHSEFEGTGIGLPLCQRIARNHGGSISVASDPGTGSTFTIELPEQQS